VADPGRLVIDVGLVVLVVFTMFEVFWCFLVLAVFQVTNGWGPAAKFTKRVVAARPGDFQAVVMFAGTIAGRGATAKIQRQ